MTPEQFKYLRTRLKMSGRALAEALGMTGGDRNIRRYEAGTTPVPGPAGRLLLIYAAGLVTPEQVDGLEADLQDGKPQAKP